MTFQDSKRNKVGKNSPRQVKRSDEVGKKKNNLDILLIGARTNVAAVKSKC